MNDRIKAHVESVFAGAPKTIKIQELKEELLGNLNSKYDDLIANGFSEDEAYKAAIASIGDVSELVQQIENESAFNRIYPAQNRKKSALLISISIGIYIMSIPILIFCSEVLDQEILGLLLMLTMAAVATGLLIYNFLSRPRYIKENETIVEEFKQWKSDANSKKQVRKSIQSILWLGIVIVYFGLSFALGGWAYSWIIFLIGALISAVIKLIFDLKE